MIASLILLLLAWTAAADRNRLEDEDVAILQLEGGGVKQPNSTARSTFSSPLQSQSALPQNRGDVASDFLGPEEVSHRILHGRARHVKHATEHFRVRFGYPRHRQLQQPFWARVAGVLGASVALLGINVLDVVWVLPYMVHKVHGTFNILFYMLVGQLFVVLSILFVIIRGPADGSAEHEHYVKILDTITAILLVVYAMYCFYEEVFSGPQKSVENPNEGDFANKVSEEEKDGNSSVDASNTKFMVLVVLGSFDQLAVYVPVLTTRILTSLELEIGVLVSTLLAVGLCFVIGQSSYIARLLSGIPMWLIVSVLAVVAVGRCW